MATSEGMPNQHAASYEPPTSAGRRTKLGGHFPLIEITPIEMHGSHTILNVLMHAVDRLSRSQGSPGSITSAWVLSAMENHNGTGEAQNHAFFSKLREGTHHPGVLSSNQD